MQKPGRKLLAAGSGKCNLTNAAQLDEFCKRYGQRERFVSPSLHNFSPAALADFFSSRGLPLVELHDGKLFPETMRSTDVLRVLLDACKSAGVDIHTGSGVTSVRRCTAGFEVESAAGGRFVCRSLVIATGGASWPVTGSTGDGYTFAASLGHTVIPPRPALVPVIARGYDCATCAGLAIRECPVRLVRNGKKIAERRGDVLFTHEGVSGPGILDFSRDFLPDDVLSLRLSVLDDSALSTACAAAPKKIVKNILGVLDVPENLALVVLARAGLSGDLRCADLAKADRLRVSSLIADFRLTIGETGGFTEAMATTGGVDTSEVSRTTMESRITEGLYFAGEVLDVDWDTGGFNLQFAFSSAVLAAESIIKKSNEIGAVKL
jgi:predicted Rossmann fold flavoprotein